MGLHRGLEWGGGGGGGGVGGRRGGGGAGHTGVPQRARGPWLTNMLSRQLASPADTNTDGGGGLHGKVSLLLITLGLDVVVEKRESECSSLRICAPHCFLHQCACVCVRVKGGCACCVFI